MEKVNYLLEQWKNHSQITQKISVKSLKYCICLFFIVMATISCHNSETNPVPKLHLEKDTINVGILLLNKTTEKKVRIDNIGESELLIKNIKSSCDCTIPILEDSIVLPNNHTFFTLSITPTDTGDFQRSVVIESNDKEIYRVLELRGSVTDSKN